MPFKGHVENGIVRFDEPNNLEDGAEVLVVRAQYAHSRTDSMPLRSTPCKFDDPFTPAIDAAEWDASQ